MALVSFTLKDFGLESVSDRHPKVVFTASGPATAGAYLLTTAKPIVVPLAVNGTGTVDLVPTTTMAQRDVYYEVSVELLDPDGGNTRVDFPDWKIYVPYAGGDLSDLIMHPANPSFVWVGTSPPPDSVPAGTLWYNPATADVKIWS